MISQPELAPPVLPSRIRRSERPVPTPHPAPADTGAAEISGPSEAGVAPRVTFSVPRAVSPRPVPAHGSLAHPALYFNRELSWIDFNWRVLYQAMDARNPLLERVRFLSIAQSNLDEFFRKRVGGLKRQLGAGVTQLSPDGRSPTQQLRLIREAVLDMQKEMARTWRQLLAPALRDEGIEVRSCDDLDPEEREAMHRYFQDHVYPVLTPLAVDPGHPFPFISNLSLSLAIVMHHPDRSSRQFARVKVPLERGRWIQLDEPGRVIALEELVARHMDELFPGMEIEGVHAFRVTRNADLRRDEEEAEDLLQMISEELRERRFAPVVRLEVQESMPDDVLEMLRDELRLDEEDIYRVDGPIDYTQVGRLAELDRPDLLFPAWEPVVPAELRPHPGGEAGGSIFDVLRRQDILVHHPYDSFSASVQRFVEEAAADPAVLGIKMTLYRTSENSPVVHALVRAAEKGKQVAVLVEVTARFDEQQNIEWAQMLERAGVHVTYGLVGLKTHAKVTLVVREEHGKIRTYAHVGTGNYHSTTARVYTDLGLLTADEDIALDLVHLFHYLTGHAPEQQYRALVVAPRDMRRAFEELVEREIEHQRQTGKGYMILKMNAIDDVGMIRALYRASRDGVRVDLIVRGHCRLRPGVPGVSENIRVISIVGRFLEHDRIFCFGNDGDRDILFGSADWRRRNLVERVEAVVRVRDALHRDRLYRTLLYALGDDRLAWELEPDGCYTLRQPIPGGAVNDYHRTLQRDAAQRRLRARARDPFPLRVAAIDAGTNAIRFVVAEFVDPTHWTEIEYQRVPVRLGHSTFLTGSLAEETMAAAVQAMARFRRSIDAHGVPAYRAVATSAVRESRNGGELVERIRRECGLRLDTITGREEARLVWLAARSRVDLGSGRWMLADLGGGSLELSVASDEGLHFIESHPMGTVRLLEDLGGADMPPAEFREMISEHAGTLRIPDHVLDPPLDGLMATGGNIETLSELAECGVDASGISLLEIDTLHAWIDRLASMTARARVEKLGLGEDRADVILPAALLYERVAALAGRDRIVVPHVGVKEGILIDLVEDFVGPW